MSKVVEKVTTQKNVPLTQAEGTGCPPVTPTGGVIQVNSDQDVTKALDDALAKKPSPFNHVETKGPDDIPAPGSPWTLSRDSLHKQPIPDIFANSAKARAKKLRQQWIGVTVEHYQSRQTYTVVHVGVQESDSRVVLILNDLETGDIIVVDSEEFQKPVIVTVPQFGKVRV